MNRHQNKAFSCLIGALNSPRKVNGYGADYALISPNEISKPSMKSSSNSYPSHFAHYLNDELLALLLTTIKEGNSLKEAYFIIRKKDPEQFRKALVKFLIENPSGTIYDKSPITSTSEQTEVESPIESNAYSNEDSKQNVAIDEYRSFLIDYDNKEFLKLFKQYRKGNKKALDKIVESQLKFVSAIANLYKNHGVEYHDLVQEGTIGLIKALELFNPDRKVQFPMYARWWIRRAMVQALINLRSAIYLPTNQVSLYNKVRKFVDCYEQEHGYEPSSSDIYIDGCDDPQNLAYLRSLPDSLNKLTTSFDDWDNVASSVFSADETLMKESQTYYINSILNKLTKKESYILRRVYGIGEKIETLNEIGEKMGLTRERVRQIKEKAIRKLRDALKLKKNNKEVSPEEEDPDDNGLTLEDIERKRKALKILEEYKKVIKSSTPSVLQRNQYNLVNETKSSAQDNVFDQKINNKKNNDGDSYIIKYDAKNCKVIDNRGSRLIVQYEDGTIDNVKNDKTRYSIVKKKNNSEIKDKFSILERAFDKKATSYKYFWFLAILDIYYRSRQATIPYRNIVIKMAAIAWKYVFDKNYDFGAVDQLDKYLEEVKNIAKIKINADEECVEKTIKDKYISLGLNKILSPLLKNVPYRFLSPWIPFTSQDDVINKSNHRGFHGLYRLLDDRIVLNSEWFNYLWDNYYEIRAFVIKDLEKSYAIE